jgi:hypothetical protein
MPKAMKDEFSDQPISRQRKFQLRMKREKRCQICGEPLVMGSRCMKHLVASRERARKRLGCKRRYYNTLGYQLEAKAKGGKKRSQKSRVRVGGT